MTHPVVKDGVMHSELRLAKYECQGYQKNGWKGKLMQLGCGAIPLFAYVRIQIYPYRFYCKNVQIKVMLVLQLR